MPRVLRGARSATALSVLPAFHASARVRFTCVQLVGVASLLRVGSVEETFMAAWEHILLAAVDVAVVYAVHAKLRSRAPTTPGTATDAASGALEVAYFGSFVLPMARSMKASTVPGDEKVRVHLQVEGAGLEAGVLEGPGAEGPDAGRPRLLVLVPRDLPGDGDIRRFIAGAQREGIVRMGEPQNKLSPRPLFAYFLLGIANGPEDVKPTTARAVFDIPTILSCYVELHAAQRSRVSRALSDFAVRLAAMVDANSETQDSVRVVSVPPLPHFRLSDVVDAVQRPRHGRGMA